ncbi:MAG: hypothetical protein KBA06_06165 [Saprospiraceae bacterium]|nr:hypothetical protein [Saprospiraceae bacterium]
MIMFYACTTNPDFPNEPHLEYVSLSKNTIKQSILFNDTIQLKMTFTDGDGDLGSDDSLSLFITDTRDQQMIPAYKIPFIPPQGSGNGISGELFVNLPPTCCIYEDGSLPCSPNPNEPTDTLTYEIYIKDRAGNSSNKVTTDPIYLQCND